MDAVLEPPEPPDPPGGASSGAVEAMQVHSLIATLERDAIQQSASTAKDKTQKKKKVTPRKSDSDKMSSVQCSLESMRNCASHLTDASTFLTTILKDVDDPAKMKRHLALLQQSVGIIQQTINQDINAIASCTNNTPGRKQAAGAHAKIHKKKKALQRDAELERQIAMTSNPQKIFAASIKQLKIKPANPLGPIAEIPAARKSGGGGSPIAPRKRAKTGRSPKKPAAAEEGGGKPKSKTKEEFKPEIRIPRPENGRLIYTPQEAANIGHILMERNDVGRTYKAAYKELMIESGRCPLKLTQLNKIIKDHGGPDKPAAKAHWNERGREEIITIEELVEKVNDKMKERTGRGWSEDDTEKILIEKLKSKAAASGLDSSKINAPAKATVRLAHSAVEEACGLVKRATSSKPPARDAKETSERAMLSLAAGMIELCFYTQPNNGVIPERFRFDATRASSGANKARKMYANAHGVPVESVHCIHPSMVINQDDAASIFTNLQGGGGNTNQRETLLVTRDAANDTSYRPHNTNDESKELGNGIKIRITNQIAASGNYSSSFVQILGFTADEIPEDKVPNGLIVLQVRGLSADGGMNPSSTTCGYLVLVRKGAGIETEMFRLHNEIVSEHFVNTLRGHLGYDDPANIPAFLTAVLSCDGGGTQEKAMQEPESLARKVSRNEQQAKLCTGTSAVSQPCDTGDGHWRMKHWMKNLDTLSTPSVTMVAPLVESLQALRDKGWLNITASKVSLITQAVSRLPTALLKSYDPQSILNGFVVAGHTDSSRQAPDLDSLFATLKKEVPLEQRTKWESDLPSLINSFSEKGQITESEFTVLGYPEDVDASGKLHPVHDSTFVSLHNRQRFTHMTHPTVIGRFSGSEVDIIERERQRLLREEKQKWISEQLLQSASYEAELHKIAGREASSDPALLLGDTFEQNQEKIIKLGGKCKSFVRARLMLSKKDPNWTEPSHVGNLTDIQMASFKVEQNIALTKKEVSWLWLVRRCLNESKPVILQCTSEADEVAAEAEQAAVAAAATEVSTTNTTTSTALSRAVIIDTRHAFDITENPFLDNQETIDKLRACFKGLQFHSVTTSMHRRVDALTRQLSLRLQPLIDSLPEKARNHFVFSFVRDNINSISQLIALFGHISDRIGGAMIGDCLLPPHSARPYTLPLIADGVGNLQGVALYLDSTSANIIQSVLVCGNNKSFIKTQKDEEKNSKSNNPPTQLSRLYPYAISRSNPPTGRWSGTIFDSLTMLLGMAIDVNGDNECLTRHDGDNCVFVWSERTMTKLAGTNTNNSSVESKQISLICATFQLAYRLMIGSNNNIVDGVPFKQFLNFVSTSSPD